MQQSFQLSCLALALLATVGCGDKPVLTGGSAGAPGANAGAGGDGDGDGGAGGAAAVATCDAEHADLCVEMGGHDALLTLCDGPGDGVSLASPQAAIDSMEGRWIVCDASGPLFAPDAELGFDVVGNSLLRLLEVDGELVWDTSDEGSGILAPAATIGTMQEVDLFFNSGAQASFFVNRGSNPEVLQLIGVASRGGSVGARYILDPTVDVAAIAAENQGPAIGAEFGHACQDDSDCPDGVCYHSTTATGSICSQLCDTETPCPNATQCVFVPDGGAGNVAGAAYCFLDCSQIPCPPDFSASCVAGYPASTVGTGVDVCIPEVAP